MRSVNLLIAGLLVVQFVNFANVSAGASTSADWNGIRIECMATDGRTTIHPESEQCRVQFEFGDDIGHVVTMEKDELSITSNAIGLRTPQRHKIKGCTEVKIDASRDRIAITCLVQHSVSLSSEASDRSGRRV